MARFWTALQASPTPMLVADDQRRYVEANVAACELLGLTREKLLTLRVDDVSSPALEGGLSETWARFLAAGWMAGRYTLRTPDGRELEVEFAATANIAPGLHLSVLHARRAPDGDRGAVSRRTTREREILRMLAMGAGTEEISTRLVVGRETVRTHIRRAMRKLEARNRTHAVALALARGYVEPSAARGAAAADIHAADIHPDGVQTARPSAPIMAAVTGAEDDGSAAGAAAELGLVNAALEAARLLLGMDAAYLAEARAGSLIYRAVTGRGDAFAVRKDDVVALSGTYDGLLLGGQVDGVVANAPSHPGLAQLPPIMTSRIGACAGAPVHLPDGTLYGALACLNRRPDPTLDERDVLSFLRGLARIVGEHLHLERLAHSQLAPDPEPAT